MNQGKLKMLITEKQLIILFDLALWFSQLNMTWRASVSGPPFSRELIEEIVNQIYSQQSIELINVK